MDSFQVFSVLADFLFYQLIIKGGMTIIVGLSACPCSSVSFCFMFYIFVIRYIECLGLSRPFEELILYHYEMTFLSPVILFALISILANSIVSAHLSFS